MLAKSHSRPAPISKGSMPSRSIHIPCGIRRLLEICRVRSFIGLDPSGIKRVTGKPRADLHAIACFGPISQKRRLLVVVRKPLNTPASHRTGHLQSSSAQADNAKIQQVTSVVDGMSTGFPSVDISQLRPARALREQRAPGRTRLGLACVAARPSRAARRPPAPRRSNVGSIRS